MTETTYQGAGIMIAVRVNGNTTETGCYVDGHWGWRGTAQAIRVARELGFTMSQQDNDIVAQWVNDDTLADDDGSLTDAVLSIADESEQWLNDHTSPICVACAEPMEWVPSGWWRHADSLRGECGTKLTDTVQGFVWHWHDGEFFLSPMCEDGDCDDETCAHWD